MTHFQFYVASDVEADSGVVTYRAYLPDRIPDIAPDGNPVNQHAPVGWGLSEWEAIGDLCATIDKRLERLEIGRLAVHYQVHPKLGTWRALPAEHRVGNRPTDVRLMGLGATQDDAYWDLVGAIVSLYE